jgi:hypothetical protein
VLRVAQALGLVSLDGTRLKANASNHKALSFEHANRLEDLLKGEVDELMGLAESAARKPRGKPLKAPEPGPVSLTDAELCLMPTAGGDFEQAYKPRPASIPRRT